MAPAQQMSGGALLDLAGQPDLGMLWVTGGELGCGRHKNPPVTAMCQQTCPTPGRGLAASPRPSHMPAPLEPGRFTRKRISVHTHLVTGF